MAENLCAAIEMCLQSRGLLVGQANEQNTPEQERRDRLTNEANAIQAGLWGTSAALTTFPEAVTTKLVGVITAVVADAFGQNKERIIEDALWWENLFDPIPPSAPVIAPPMPAFLADANLETWLLLDQNPVLMKLAMNFDQNLPEAQRNWDKAVGVVDDYTRAFLRDDLPPEQRPGWGKLPEDTRAHLEELYQTWVRPQYETAKDELEDIEVLRDFYSNLIQSPELMAELVDSSVLTLFVNDFLTSENVQAVIAEQLFTVQGVEGESTVFDKAIEGAIKRALGTEGSVGTLSDAIALAVDMRMTDYGFTAPDDEETVSEDMGFVDSSQIDPVTGEVIEGSTALLPNIEGETVLPEDVQAEIQYLIDSALVDIRADVNKAGAAAGVALVTATGVMGVAATALGTALAAMATANAAMTAAANVKCDCSNGGTTNTAANKSDQRNPPYIGGV